MRYGPGNGLQITPDRRRIPLNSLLAFSSSGALLVFDPRCYRCRRMSHCHWSPRSCHPRPLSPNWNCWSPNRMRSPIRCCCLSCPTNWRRTRSSCWASACGGPSFRPLTPLPAAPPPRSWAPLLPFGLNACSAAWCASSGGRISASPCTRSSSGQSAGTSGTGCRWESRLPVWRICGRRIESKVRTKSRLGAGASPPRAVSPLLLRQLAGC